MFHSAVRRRYGYAVLLVGDLNNQRAIPEDVSGSWNNLTWDDPD
jgi:hypothetical protein